MAPTFDAAKPGEPGFSVQEFARNVEGPPSLYHLKETLSPAENLLVLDLETIDIALLSSSSTKGEEEIKKMRAALESCGFFQAVNHGLPTSFLDEVHAMSREYFSLPKEEKLKYAKTPENAQEYDGYGNDKSESEKELLDWNELVPYRTARKHKEVEQMAQKPREFQAMEKSLNLEERGFIDMYGETPTWLSRFSYYPPCPRPDLVLAGKAHGDASGTTFLLADREVEGLQTLKDGQWHRVPLPVSPDAIFYIIGDQTEIMSNGILKSPVHRVATNEKRERITITIFCIPDPTAEVKPADELIDEKNPRLYKSAVNYVSEYFRTFNMGGKPIDAYKI